MVEAGQSPFDPAMMLKIITYGYCTGCFSSRRLEAKLHEDPAFIYLAGGNRPDHRAKAAFRQRYRQRIHDLFVRVLQMIAQKAGLVRLGHVALDGTKIKAHASRHKAMSYGRMKKVLPELEREVAELLRQAEETDAREEAEAPKKATTLLEELARREQRLARIRAAMAALEARAREEQEQESLAERPKAKKKKRDRSGPPPQDPPAPQDKAQYNFTDPESRIMLDNSTKAYVQAYNVQLAVDGKSQLIVGGLVSNQAADGPHLPELVAKIKENLGRFPREVESQTASVASQSYQTQRSSAARPRSIRT
jgi:hypothetical protein